MDLLGAKLVAYIGSVKETRGVAQDWFQRIDAQLNDVPPARRLREGQLDGAGPQVLAATRAFADAG